MEGTWDNRQIHLTNHPAGTGEAVTHGAALSLRGDDLLAVGQQLTLHLVADGDAVVADAHATRLWLPDFVVLVDLLIHRAVFPELLVCSCNRGAETGGTFFKSEHSPNPSAVGQG